MMFTQRVSLLLRAACRRAVRVISKKSWPPKVNTRKTTGSLCCKGNWSIYTRRAHSLARFDMWTTVLPSRYQKKVSASKPTKAADTYALGLCTSHIEQCKLPWLSDATFLRHVAAHCSPNFCTRSTSKSVFAAFLVVLASHNVAAM